MQGLALIDLDNFRDRNKKSKADLEFDTETLVNDVARAFATVFPAARELDVRLYGGWIDETGSPSRDASWLYGLLPNLRGRRHGLIIRPTLAKTMLQFPKFLLRGTVRVQTRRQRQKMIDGMIGCDALYIAATNDRMYISIVTDDDDLLPATLSAHRANTDMLTWMRSRAVGSAPNDAGLLNEELKIHQFRT